jgi:hypothetical protein
MSLTEKEINEYFKLKEKKDKQNKYLYDYIKIKYKIPKRQTKKNIKKLCQNRMRQIKNIKKKHYKN